MTTAKKKRAKAPVQAKPKHGKFIVWECVAGRTRHCWHKNYLGLRARCCWCGEYAP